MDNIDEIHDLFECGVFLGNYYKALELPANVSRKKLQKMILKVIKHCFDTDLKFAKMGVK